MPNIPHRQDEPLMPMSPQDRIRQQAIDSMVPEIAQLLYRCDKGHRMAHLSDLKDDELAVYVADALMITDAEARTERVTRLNRLRARRFAAADDESETVMRQARRDIAHYQHPKCCICQEPVIANRVEVLTGTARDVAHGLCCAQREDRFEFVSEFAYQQRGL